MFHTLTLPPSSTPLQFQSQSHRGRASSSVRCTAAVQDRPATAAATASLYEVLRVRRDASSTEIKVAYRNLAKLYHPDASSEVSSDGRDFIRIHRAYETLSDPASRAVYDMSLGFGGRLTAASFACDSPVVAAAAAARRRSGFYATTTTRRWETDQCW